MEIEIQDSCGNKRINIIEIKPISFSKSLFLVEIPFYNQDDEQFYFIRNIIMMAYCKLENEKSFIGVLVDRDDCVPEWFILKSSNMLFLNQSDYLLIDYKKYKKICNLTGEKKLNLKDLIMKKLDCVANLNSFLFYENKFYNCDEQISIFERIDELKKINS